MAAPNPFAPPGADLTPPEPRPPGAPWKAVLVGLVVDIAFTIVFSFILSLFYGGYLAASGHSVEEIQALTEQSELGGFYMFALYAVGGTGSLIGGYICARIARLHEYRVVAILIAVSIVLGWIIAPAKDGGLEFLLTSILTIVATLAGAWLGVRRNRSPR